MQIPPYRTYAEIDLSAARENYRAVCAAAPKARVCCVVKANAYGHGAVRLAREYSALGCRNFAVATLTEALELREAGIAGDVLILGYTPPDFAQPLLENSLAQTVFDLETAREYSVAAQKARKTLTLHAKIETGMGRLGFLSAEPLAEAMSLPGLRVEGAFSHFAVSDEAGGEEYTCRQFETFTETVCRAEDAAGLRLAVKHICNSGGIFNYPEYHLDMVRAGICLYGCAPEPIAGRDPARLTPVMSLKTRIASVKRVKAGQTVSYGRTYTAQAPSNIAVLPAGYADGLPRIASGKFSVAVGDKLYPQVGRICMDMCMVNLGEDAVPAGTEAVIFGKHPAQTAKDLAECAGTISYEVLCAVSGRVPRSYTGEATQRTNWNLEAVFGREELME
ncbi:MAG: alanine racemase [Oscillospiraceae bacterium]|nr:alanine racemase [Oscillospiraceae bacterium]